MGLNKNIDNDRYPDQINHLLGTKAKLTIKGRKYLGEIVRCDLPRRELVGGNINLVDLCNGGYLSITGGQAEYNPGDFYREGYDIIYRIVKTNRYVSMRQLHNYPDHHPLTVRTKDSFAGKSTRVMYFYKGPYVQARVIEDCGPLTMMLLESGPNAGRIVSSLDCQFSLNDEAPSILRYAAEIRSYQMVAKIDGPWAVANGYKKVKNKVTVRGPVVMDTVKRRRVATASNMENAVLIANLFNSKENQSND